MISNVSGAQNFTGTTTNDILITAIFPWFNWTYNSSNQFNKTSMCIDMLNSTESSLWVLCTKLLSELELNLHMLQ